MMLPDYPDIRALTSREPEWFDDNGVPRFAAFNPDLLGVYERWAVLYLIACQSCGQRFKVAEGWSDHRICKHGVELIRVTRDSVASLHYGDPPRHDAPSGQRCAGETMNCDDLRVLEFWHRPSLEEWRRVPEFEIPLADG